MYRCHIRFEFFNPPGTYIPQDILQDLSACFCNAIDQVLRDEELTPCGKQLTVTFKEVEEK